MRSLILASILVAAGCGSVAEQARDVGADSGGDAAGDTTVPDGGDADSDADADADADADSDADADADADADSDADGVDAVETVDAVDVVDAPDVADAADAVDAVDAADAADRADVVDAMDATDRVEAIDVVDVPDAADVPDGDAGVASCYAAGMCGAGQVCDLRTCVHPPPVLGTCIPRPGMCPLVFDPVCGCDGNTYGNDCDRQAAEVALLHGGACGDAGRPVCDGLGDGRRGWWDFHSESEWSLYCVVDCSGCTAECSVDASGTIEGWYAVCSGSMGGCVVPSGLIVGADCM